MSNDLSGAHRHERHLHKLAWLRARPELLVRLPSAGQDVTPDQSEALDSAVRQMKHVRLYAPTSSADTVRWGIRALVSELRGEVLPGPARSPSLKGATKRA